MQSEEIKMRFGRCPYCRTMIYQNPKAVIYYCNKCRTPIRGKNPEPTEDTDYALSQLEILSADTASIFSDELELNPQPSVVDNDGDQPPLLSSSTSYLNFNPSSQEIGASSPYRGLSSVRTGPRSRSTQAFEDRISPLGSRFDDLRNGSNMNQNQQNEAEMRSSHTAYAEGSSSLNKRVNELRGASRRTRRPSSTDSDVDTPTSNEGYCTPRNAYNQDRRSQLRSEDLQTSMNLSGPDLGKIAGSPLTDPAFHKDLLLALDNLRKFVATVEEPRSFNDYRYAGSRQPHQMSASYGPDRFLFQQNNNREAITRRDFRLFRRLESQLAHVLPNDGSHRNPSSSSSSSASSNQGERRARKHHCRPILGGAPFVVCYKCSELLQMPIVLCKRKITRLQCGHCSEVLMLTLPASASTEYGNPSADYRPNRTFSAPQSDSYRKSSPESTFEEYGPSFASSSLSGEALAPGHQRRQELPLHRIMGYNSPSPLLQSRRF